MQVGDRVRVKEQGTGFVSGWDPFENRFVVQLDQGGRCFVKEQDMSLVTVTVLEDVIEWNDAGGYGYSPALRNWLREEQAGKRVRITIKMLDEEG